MTGDEPQVEVAPAADVAADPTSMVGSAPPEQAAAPPLAIPVTGTVEPAAPATDVSAEAPVPGPAEAAAVYEPEPTVDAELGGYAELRFSWLAGVTGNPATVTERVRPRLAIGPADGPLAGRLKGEVVVEAALTQGRDTGKELSDTLFASDVGELLTLSGCTYAPDPRYASVSDVLSVERLHVDFNLKALDLTVGRQAIRWGSGLYFHPTDLYAEVLIAEPWREPQGINAVKASVPVGTSDVTAVVAVGDDLSPFYTTAQGTADAIVFGDLPLSAAVRGTLRVGGVDIAAIGQAKADQAWFVGGDVRGTLGVGYWAEGGWHGAVHTDALDADGYVEVVGGLDYSFPLLELLYVAAEYRYDGSGAAPDAYDYTSRLSGSLPFDCAVLPTSSSSATRITLGRHYVAGVVRLGLTRDFSVTSAVLANLEDGTGMVIPGLALAAGDRVALNLGAQLPFGADGEFRPAASSLTYTLGTASVDLSGLVPDATITGWARYSF